jgi:hypothetical protein
MSSLKRQALQATQKGLTRVKSRIDRLLTSDEGGRQPYVARLAEAYERGWQGCPAVFVLSTGRVGSQTLTALLALSPAVVSEHEPFPRLVKASFDAYLEGGDLAASARWREVVYAARDDLVCEANRRGKIYVETNNRLTYLAPVLAACFPASRFIHLHRHPYEVVRSAMRRGYYQSHNWDFARVRPRPGEPLAAEWDALPRLEKCGWFWARINEEARAFMATLPAERALDLRADLLFAGDESTLRRIFAFVGVDFPKSELVEEVLGRKLNAAQRGSFPTPSEWSEEDRQAVRRRVERVARELGYEP